MPSIIKPNILHKFFKPYRVGYCFKDKVRHDIRSHLDEQEVEELEKAAVMGDDYALTQNE